MSRRLFRPRRAPGLLALAVCGLTLVVLPGSVAPMGRQSALGTLQRAAGTAPGQPVAAPAGSPEARLVHALQAIRENRLGPALAEIDALLEEHPNFRLAQLVRGDLLAARARPLHGIGDGARGPEDRLADLRAEARAHLVRLRQDVPRGLVPRYLLRLEERQRHAIVVDTARSTLYLFENHGGEARYVADYYISVGKNGTDKLREGDKRTPLGVYHVAAELPQRRLSAFYGAGAFPLDYPNEWDARQGRKGHGIWLHGVPRDTYSRPPRASDGCVVLTNQDLDTVSRHLQIGITPVIIANGVEWVTPAAREQQAGALAHQLEAWRTARASGDTAALPRFYARNLQGSGQPPVARARARHAQASSPDGAARLSGLSMFLYPGRDDLAVVEFTEENASNAPGSHLRKRQYWAREGDTWKILYEGSA